MKLSDFKIYRQIIGGVWEKFSWHCPVKKKKQTEWRKTHNGKWTEYKESV
jgi:hypothetical protein